MTTTSTSCINLNKSGEKGNALIILLIVLPVLLGVGGLVLDWGRGVWVRTQLQKAADAGALAGAAELPYIQLAEDSASLMVESNFPGPDEAVYAVAGDEYSVDLTENVPVLLMKLFGYDSIPVRVTATAIAAQPMGGIRGGGFPIAIINPDLNNDPCDDLTEWNYGKVYIIGYGEDNVMVEDWANGCDDCPLSPGLGIGTGENAAGWRGILALGADGTLGDMGAVDFIECMVNGFPGELHIGDEVPMSFGNMASAMNSARDELLGEDPLLWEDFDPVLDADNSRVRMVPVIHLINETRGDTYTLQDWQNDAAWNHENVVIDGFAPFFILTPEEARPYLNVHGVANDWILGIYIPGVRTHEFLPPAEGTEVPEWGLYTPPRLIE